MTDNDDSIPIGGAQVTDEEYPNPKTLEDFFRNGWDEIEVITLRADLPYFIWYIANQTRGREGLLLNDMEIEDYLEAILDILRHPERDAQDLHAPAPETPTWQWLGRVFLAAAQKAAPRPV